MISGIELRLRKWSRLFVLLALAFGGVLSAEAAVPYPAFALTPTYTVPAFSALSAIPDKIPCLDLGFAWVERSKMIGVQGGLFVSDAKGQDYGAQVGLVTSAEMGGGVQVGLINRSAHGGHLLLGVVNLAQESVACQIGVINWANQQSSALQIGVLCMNSNTGVLPLIGWC